MQRPIPDIRTMLGELVAMPSVSSVSPAWDQSNEAVVARLAQWLGDLGFSVETMPVPGAPGKSNLIATKGQGPGGLVLSGHTDTVPFDDQRWQSDPFALTEHQDRWYGLGTCDMKGFFPLALEAAWRMRDQALAAPLVILATADEESAMGGARALIEAGRPKARHALIGEPTELRPVRMHKGIMMERLIFRGQSGHSSNPALGRNALEGMNEALGRILAYRDELQRDHRHPGFRVAYPTLNPGHIHGGDNPNRICGECELHFDLRPLPGMDPAALRHGILERVQPVADQRQLSCTFEPLFDGVPPFEEPASARLAGICERLTGHAAEGVAFATEAPFLQQLGMETLVLGPGSIDQAHQPDEFLALSQIEPMVTILTGLIEQCCSKRGAQGE
ncbi:acetylornithine deacetylase [Halomonadaceae bacterium KBTZ08]